MTITTQAPETHPAEAAQTATRPAAGFKPIVLSAEARERLKVLHQVLDAPAAKAVTTSDEFDLAETSSQISSTTT